MPFLERLTRRKPPGQRGFEKPAQIVKEVDPAWLEYAALALWLRHVRIRKDGPDRPSGVTLFRRPKRFIYPEPDLDNGRIRSFHFADVEGQLRNPSASTDARIQVVSDKTLPGGYRLMSYHTDPESGFTAAVFCKRVDQSPQQIVVCFPSTARESLWELGHNVQTQLLDFELPRRYDQSIVLAQAVNTTYPHAEVILTGHSLGGSQASWAAVHLGLKAVVTNAPAMPMARLPEELKIRQKRRVVGIRGDDNILCVNVVGDPVSNPDGKQGDYSPFTFPGIPAAQVGERLMLPSDEIEIPKSGSLRLRNRVLLWYLGFKDPRVRYHRDRQLEVRNVALGMKHEWRKGDALHVVETVIKLLAAKLEKQGIDPSGILSVDLNLFLSDQRPKKRDPFIQRLRAIPQARTKSKAVRGRKR